jgi:hypothetical protein
MNSSPNSLALTMKDAAKLVGVDYRTIKLGIEKRDHPHDPTRPAPDDPSCRIVARLWRRRLTGRRFGHRSVVRFSARRP